MAAVVKCSVICVTYNHARYIRQCLDGFVMQKTNFPFEVIVHDDASTDGTATIVAEYAAKYPDIIKPVLQKENQWRKGKTMSKTFIYPRLHGEYVAYCEGDDYWTDEHKLQRQIDFLDTHPDYSTCFHPVQIIVDGSDAPPTIFPSPSFRFNKTTLYLSDLLQRNFMQTTSIVFRWRFYRDGYDLIPDLILPGDHFINLLHAQVGKIGFLPQTMAVYRRHAKSVWTGARREPNWFVRSAPYAIRFAEAVDRQFNHCDHTELEFLRTGARFAKMYNPGVKSSKFRLMASILSSMSVSLLKMLSPNKSVRDGGLGAIKGCTLAFSWLSGHKITSQTR